MLIWRRDGLIQLCYCYLKHCNETPCLNSVFLLQPVLAVCTSHGNTAEPDPRSPHRFFVRQAYIRATSREDRLDPCLLQYSCGEAERSKNGSQRTYSPNICSPLRHGPGAVVSGMVARAGGGVWIGGFAGCWLGGLVRTRVRV